MIQGQNRPGVRRSRSVLSGSATIDGVEAVILDLSATGVRTGRPDGFTAAEGTSHRIELRVDEGPVVHLDAALVRLADAELAFRFGAVASGEADALATAIERFGRPHDGIAEA